MTGNDRTEHQIQGKAMPYTTYDLEEHIPELYDRFETHQEDVDLLRHLIGSWRGSILEPFSGTGRILLPLLEDGHRVVGLDLSKGMLDRAQVKIRALSGEVGKRAFLAQADLVKEEWPVEGDFDLVVLGGNCLYELATPDEQQRVIQKAASVLRPKGVIFIDNDYMEGELDHTWRDPEPVTCFPTGKCSDGTFLESTMHTVWFDAPKRLVCIHRRVEVRRPGEKSFDVTYEQQKHPVSISEVRGWLQDGGFSILREYGDYKGRPLTANASSRAIFWAEAFS